VEKLLALRPDDARVLLLRGQLDLDAGRAEEALPWLRRARDGAPYEMDTNEALAAACRALNRREEAETYARAAQQVHKDLQRIVDIAKEILSGKNSLALRYEAGTVMRRLGQEQSAVHWFVSAHVLDRDDQPTRRALAECLHKEDELTDEDWLEAFAAWGRHGYFEREADFPAALAAYRQALAETARADPPFYPPPDFLPQLSPGRRRLRWRRAHHFPQVEAAWNWLAEMHNRRTDNLPPVTEAEFAHLARWFDENAERLKQSAAPSHLLDLGDGNRVALADLRSRIGKGPRALGAGQLAEDLRKLRARYGDGGQRASPATTGPP
jgi:tetratricopeptide (TPR) repeat protein